MITTRTHLSPQAPYSTQAPQERINTHVAGAVVSHATRRRELAYIALDHSWPALLLALHEACVNAYATYAALDEAWRVTGQADPALDNAALVAYAHWQAIETLAAPALAAIEG